MTFNWLEISLLWFPRFFDDDLLWLPRNFDDNYKVQLAIFFIFFNFYFVVEKAR